MRLSHIWESSESLEGGGKLLHQFLATSLLHLTFTEQKRRK